MRHGFEQNESELKVSQPPAPSIQNAVQEELLPREAVSTTLGDELSGYSMVGVAFDTYIILQNTKQLILIDQHGCSMSVFFTKN